MDLQNYFYTFVQFFHNFGAVAVVASAVLSCFQPFCHSFPLLRKLAWVLLIGWVIQGVSGAGFGAVSYYYHRRFPDIHGIALGALLLKMFCTALGVLLAGLYLRREAHWSERIKKLSWRGMLLMASVSLSAAAFLRWFS